MSSPSPATIPLPDSPATPISSANSLPYRIGPTPDKGLGVFATRFIPMGEMIISERRLFEPARTHGDIEAGVARLNKEEAALFWSFTDGWGGPEAEGKTIHGIMRTNGIPCEDHGYTPGDGGIFPISSRINHSCRPNVFWMYSMKQNRLIIRASADIQDTEEMTATYTTLTQYRTLRQMALFTQFGFTCRCSACKPDNFGDESDTRRIRIQELTMKLEHAKKGEHHASALRWVKERTRLAEEEGLNDTIQRSKDHMSGCMVAAACADYDEARRQLGVAWAYKVLSSGSDSDLARKLLKYHRSPQDYPGAGGQGTKKLPAICDRCGKEEAGGFKGAQAKGGSCGECHCAIYCSKKCKVAHADRHRPICAVIRAGRAK